MCRHFIVPEFNSALAAYALDKKRSETGQALDTTNLESE